MIETILIILCIVLHWIGGEKWAHTLFRDAGCTACILSLAIILLGFNFSLLAIIPLVWVGLTIGDHEKWQWSIQAFVVSLGLLPYAIMTNELQIFSLMMFSVVAGTYLSSKYLSNRWMIDVWCRGTLYATIPMWFYLLN